MKPAQLTLEHLAGYLPYGLKMKRFDGLIVIINPYSLPGATLTNFKPLLRPLSDLTKEIKHNGERFVPIVEIAKIEAPCIEGAVERINSIIPFNRGVSFKSRKQGVLYQYEGVTMEITHYRNAIFHKTVVNGNDSWVFSYFHNYPAIIQKLYEWHFDINGLIDAGLAVDVNQVKEEN